MTFLFFVEGALLPGSSDLRHLSSSGLRLRRLFVFLLFGTFCPRQRSVGLEGVGGPVGFDFEPVAGKCGVILRHVRLWSSVD